MKKMIVMLAVCSTATVAMGAIAPFNPSPTGVVWDLSGTIDMTVGSTITVFLLTASAGDVWGADLFFSTTGPFAIGTPTSTGALTATQEVFTTGNSDRSTYFCSTTNTTYPTNQAAAYATSKLTEQDMADPENPDATLPGPIRDVLAGKKLARLIITATGIGNGTLSTTQGQYSTNYQQQGESCTQATLNLRVLPEPMTGLLLLAGLPLIRRRRA